MTIKEVAKQAGVSVSTVSKIINNKADNISPATIDRVLEVAKKNHYVPYGKIKNTLNSKGFTLAVMLRSVASSSNLLKGVISGAKTKGYAVLLFDSSCSQEQEDSNFRELSRHHVDGLLWEPVSCRTEERERELAEAHICLQMCSGSEPAWYQDNFRQFGRLMTQRLVNLSHTSIAFVKGENCVASSTLLEGYEQCLYENKIPYDAARVLEVEGQLPEQISVGVSAFVCADPLSAQRVICRLTAAGFTVPGDASVIALASDVPCPSHEISLERVPYDTYGLALVDSLIARCEDRDEGQPPPAPAEELTSLATLARAFSARKKRVIVLGSINADITLNVSQLPQIGSSVVSHNMSVNLGGKGANQAMGVAKLGWEACLIAKVGNDVDATMAFQALNSEGVNTTGVRRELGSDTGKAYIHVQEDGESMMTLFPGANGTMTAEYVRSMSHLFQNAGYCLLSTGPAPDCVLQAARLSKGHGAQTIFKPSSGVEIPEELYRLTDIFVPNRHAAAKLAPFPEVERQAEYFLEQGVRNVIITLGHRGCYLRTTEQAFWYDAPPVATVDATGAADAFIAALAVYLLQNYSLEDAVEIASHAAGFCVTKQGVIPALVDRNSLDQYLATRPRPLRCSPSPLPASHKRR